MRHFFYTPDLCRVEAPVETSVGATTTIVETYDLSMDFPAAGGQWAGMLIFSQPVTPATVQLLSEDKSVTYSLTETDATNVLLAQLVYTVSAPRTTYKLVVTHTKPDGEKPCLLDARCMTAASQAELQTAIDGFSLKDQ